KVKLSDIKDGTSSTLLIGERPPSPTLEWGWAETAIRSNFQGPSGNPGGAFWDMDVICGTAQRWQGPSGPNFGFSGTNPGYNCPAVAVYGPPGPRQATNAIQTPSNYCDFNHYWSNHPGGAMFAMSDASVRFISYSAAPIMPALGTRNGGEIFDQNQ